MGDECEQEDELTVLESIYPNTFVRNEDSCGGKIEIPIVLDDILTISYASELEKTTATAGVKTNDGLKEIEVSHLPPIVLYFSCPSDYPSCRSPEFTLSCKWLTIEKLEILCQSLDDLWTEQGPGSVILFQWIQFLSDEVCTVLGITSPFLLAIQQPCATSRAYQDATSADALASTLSVYDHSQKDLIFNSSTFTCAVCFCDVRGSDCVKFQVCGHIYCQMCMREYFKVQIMDGAVTRLNCPGEDCSMQANPKQVQELVEPELYARYEKFLLQSGLDSMSDIVYCPRKDCQEPVLIESTEAPCVCSSCMFAFCLNCKRSYHGVEPCPVTSKEFQKLKIQYENGTHEERELLEKRYGKKRLKQLFEECVSVEWLQENTKECPVCKAKIQKTEGCNKMTCFKCSRDFCWICMVVLPKVNPYFHFNNMYSNCFNKLFEGVVDDSDEEDEFY